MKHEFAENIKNLRKSRNLTQSELANRLGVNKSIISAYENQQRLPSIDMLIKLSLEFNVSMEYLLGISKNKSIDVSRLTDSQISIISQLIADFEDK